MRAREMLLEILGPPFGDQLNRQAGGVGGDDRAGLAHGFHALEELAFDFEILGDRLDDPVRLAAPRHVVFEISRRD